MILLGTLIINEHQNEISFILTEIYKLGKQLDVVICVLWYATTLDELLLWQL